MKLDIELVDGGKLPKAFNESAGLDLYTSKDITIEPYGTETIPTGIKVQPESSEWYMRIVPRSSTLKKYALYIQEGIIDPDYTGELFISVRNLGGEKIIIPKLSRLAQMIPAYRPKLNINVVSKLKETKRGDNGFGSTGSN